LYVRRHLQFTWWSLLCFVTLGIILEAMHGLKIGWYLEEPYEIRRLMWTLAYAHGTLLSLVHGAFALTIYVVPAELARYRGIASPLLISASVLLPGGFFLGGCFIYAGDPGLGVWLVPVGALCLFTSVLLMSVGLVRTQAFTAETVEDAEQKTKRKRRRG
jgi:hypothetical protein